MSHSASKSHPRPKLFVVFGSTRQGRQGEPVFAWALRTAQADPRFEVEGVDLRDWELPLFDDREPPDAEPSQNPAVRRWAAKVGEADAYLIVTAEYNHGPPAVLKNALDSAYPEYNHKPVGFVSYGGASGGARAVEQLRGHVSNLKMASVATAVHLARFSRTNPADYDELYGKSLASLLDDLALWADGFRPIRAAAARRDR